VTSSLAIKYVETGLRERARELRRQLETAARLAQANYSWLATTPRRKPRHSRPRILLGHDFPEVRAIYASYFEAAGFEVLAASDALMVIDLALESTPDVIVIDDGLPALTGWQLVRVLTLHPLLGTAPILLLGGLLSESRRAAEASGASGVIPKPCSGSDMVDQVKRTMSAAAPC
jgi:CheY-like chemotaxis protein